MVVSGSTCSILPHVSDAPPTCHLIDEFTGGAIDAWGFVNRSIDIGHGVVDWKFLIADMPRPILGYDYLTGNNITISFRKDGNKLYQHDRLL